MNRMKSKQHIRNWLIAFFAITSSVALAQNNAIVLNGGQIVLNGGTSATPAYVVVNQSNTSGITRTSNGGFIKSENQFNYVKWLAGTTTGSFVFPFGLSGGYIPMTFNKSNATGSPLTISTWHTDQQNTPKPLASGVGAVTNMHGYGDSVHYAIDRFWDVQASTSSSADLDFSYLGSENTTSAPTQMVKAIRWNGSSWLSPVIPGSGSMGVTTGVGSAGDYANQNSPAAWALIVKSDCPSDFISYTQNSYCHSDTAMQEVAHTNDTLNGTFTFTPTGLDIDNMTGEVNPNTSQPGTYSVTYTVPAANGCPQVIATTALTINSNPTIAVNSDATETTTCQAMDVTLTASGANSYSWMGPNFTGTTDSVTVTDLTPADAGWYIVTATDTNGCTAMDSIKVNVNKLPMASANAGGGTFCQGETAQLSGTGGASYNWTGPNGFTSSDENPSITNFSPSNAGTYIVIVTDTNGCSNSDSVALSIGNLTGLSVSASENQVCPGKNIVLTADGADSYTWSGPNGFSSTGATVNLDNMSDDKAGTYYVTAQDSAGCATTDTITVGIGMSSKCLFIPGLVTPNGDHKNDKWVISGIEAFPKAKVYIFNRWGNVVFQASPYKNNWEGQVNQGLDVGKGKLPSATYFYVIKLNNGKDKDIKGYIELQY